MTANAPSEPSAVSNEHQVNGASFERGSEPNAQHGVPSRRRSGWVDDVRSVLHSGESRNQTQAEHHWHARAQRGD